VESRLCRIGQCKNHGVSPEFIDKLQGSGYKHPEPDLLVAIRTHNFIAEQLHALGRGMQNLSINQLVSMRISRGQQNSSCFRHIIGL
jgi:hypothetical protein